MVGNLLLSNTKVFEPGSFQPNLLLICQTFQRPAVDPLAAREEGAEAGRHAHGRRRRFSHLVRTSLFLERGRHSTDVAFVLVTQQPRVRFSPFPKLLEIKSTALSVWQLE